MHICTCDIAYTNAGAYRGTHSSSDTHKPDKFLVTWKREPAETQSERGVPGDTNTDPVFMHTWSHMSKCHHDGT